ncbi:unnamed protein product, partial [Iphiclides podalirius]
MDPPPGVPPDNTTPTVYDSKLTEPPQWERSPLYEQRKTTTNQSTFQGDQRKEIWAAIRTLLLDGTLQKSFDKAFDDIAADFTRRLGELRFAENALNEEISTEVYRWALETIGVMVFGGRLGCLDGPAHLPTDENRPREMTSLDDDIPETCSLSKRRIEELTPAERLVRITLEIANGGFLVRSEDTLNKHSETFRRALKTFDDHYSLTEHFLLQAVQSLNTNNLRPEQILVDKLRPLQNRVLPLVADILLAGVDPLAQTALGMFYQLSLNAARQQRAHDEVAWSVASRDAGASCTDMPFISACAREALRMHPVTGGVLRRSTAEMVVGGYEVPAGVDIVLAHGVSSKDEKQWGRAGAYIPERWCGEGWGPLRASRAHPAASMPFGEGCPAAGAVSKMLTSLAVRVLDNYRLEWHGPPPNVATPDVNRLQPPYYFVLQNAA